MGRSASCNECLSDVESLSFCHIASVGQEGFTRLCGQDPYVLFLAQEDSGLMGSAQTDSVHGFTPPFFPLSCW